MKYNVAINGYGRIGQSVLRAIYSSPYRSLFTIVAINELADIETLTYLTRYDTTHGRFPYKLQHRDNILFIEDDEIKVLNEPDPDCLPWHDYNVDLLFECSGTFQEREIAEKHLNSGAKRVLLSHPATAEVDATIIFGYNDDLISAEHRIVSNASCTTNCIVPLLSLLDAELGIVNGVTTTIHSAMNDQPVIDSYHHTNLRLTRSAMHSIIPVDTSLAKGIDRLLPSLAGRFECLHVRVPTINVSVMDLSINLKKSTSAAQINSLVQRSSQTNLKGLLGYTEEPHASIDFNTDSHSSILDGTQTRVCCGSLAKMLCWFDNEWGFANRMLDVANKWLGVSTARTFQEQ